MKIPKILHTCWAGGEKLLPDANIQVILEWLQANPSLALWLWVDYHTAPAEINLNDYYQIRFTHVAQKLKLKVDLAKLVLKDITKENIADEYIRYEIDRLRPNYGASSDQVRYKFLHKFGGAYIDSDVGIGVTSLEESGIFDEEYKNHVLYIDPNCQNKGIIGNDFFICTQSNPLMKILNDAVKFNYGAVDKPFVASNDESDNKQTESVALFPISTKLTYSIAKNIFSFLDDKTRSKTSILNKSWHQFAQTCRISPLKIEDNFFRRCPIQMRAYLFDQSTYIIDITVKLTGNDTLLSILEPYQKNKDNIQVKNILAYYRTPKRELGLSWTKRKVRRCDKNTAIATIITSIKFEVRVMKILRLEDHVENLAEAANYPIKDAIEDLLAALQKQSIDFSHVVAVQNTLRYESIVRFYDAKLISQEKYFHFNAAQAISMTGVNGLHIYSGILRVTRINEICNTIKQDREVRQTDLKELKQIVDFGNQFLLMEIKRLKKELKQLNHANIDYFDSYRINILEYAFREYGNLFELKDTELRPILLEHLRINTKGIQKNISGGFLDLEAAVAKFKLAQEKTSSSKKCSIC